MYCTCREMEHSSSMSHTGMDTTGSLSVGQPPTGKAAEFKDKLSNLIAELDGAFDSSNCTKENIVRTIRSYLPNFEHFETGKSLDGKM